MNPEVVYITGMGRSGSTLLARVLGSIDGVVNLGEAAAFWTHRSMRDRRIPCSCGLAAESCPAWAPVAAQPPFDRDLGSELSIRRAFRPGWVRSLGGLGNELGRFYREMSDRFEGAVLIDSSKSASIAHAINQVPRVDVRTVHLVRDPRGVAASRASAKDYLEVFSPFYVAVRWNAVNLVAGRLAARSSYQLVRYEDFTAYPTAVVKAILSGTSLSQSDLPDFESGPIGIEREHALAGNPDKLGNKPFEIRKAGSPSPNPAVTALTAPLLMRYGYPMRMRQ